MKPTSKTINLSKKNFLNTLDQAREKFKDRLFTNRDMNVYNFEDNVLKHKHKFDFYSNDLNLAIKLENNFSHFDEFDNPLGMKEFYLEKINLKVLKVSDYQVLVDLDQVIRFIKRNYIFKVL